MYNTRNETTFFKEKLNSSDKGSLALLVDKYHHQLCLYALHLTNDHDESKDIVQNVFLRLWQQRHRLENVTNIKSFMYSAVYNGFLNYLRDRKNLLDIEKVQISEIDSIAHSESEGLIKRQMDLVKKQIEKLPPKCKRVFVLSKQEGLTNIEIADFMGISKKTVENHISKAFRMLRDALGDRYSEILFLLFDIKK